MAIARDKSGKVIATSGGRVSVGNCGTGAGGFKHGNTCAKGGGGGRTKIGKGNSGDVFREGDEAVKSAVRADGTDSGEGAIYAKVGDVEGIAPGYREGDEIRTPFYDEILSIDAVPDKDVRESMGGVVAKNTKRLLNAMNGLSEEGIDYNDPLQVGFDDDFKSNVFDFGNAGKVDVAEAYRANFGRLSKYMEDFGAPAAGEKIQTTAGVHGFAQSVSKGDAATAARRIARQTEKGSNLGVHLKSIGAEKLVGYEVKHAYYANNARHVDAPGVLQSEPHEGTKVLLSSKPISDDIIRQYDLTPVIHPAKRSKAKTQ